MKHSFIRRQTEPLAGKDSSSRRIIDDPTLDRLLADCKSSAGQKMPNEIVLRHVAAWQKSGDIAELNAVVTGNIRLMVKCANRYQCAELPLWDLVAEAACGFRIGLQAFDMEQADRGPVANYAMIWGRKKMLEYIEMHSRTVRISTRTEKAAKKGLKILEREVAKHEHAGISLDQVLHDRPPSERVGALDCFGRGGSLERMQGEGYLEEDWNAALSSGMTDRVYHPSIAGKLALPPNGCPTEPSPRGDEAAEAVYMACRALPEDTQQLVYAYYKMDGYNFEGECERLGIDPTDGKVFVQRAVSQLRSLNGRIR